MFYTLYLNIYYEKFVNTRLVKTVFILKQKLVSG